jgi:1-acyl-sn-glycerol-3-phosphate acyltransferase
MPYTAKHVWLEAFYRHGAKVVVRLLYNCKFSDFDNVPKTGAAIIIANHITYMDGMVLNAAIDRPIRFVIDHDIYHVPAVKHFMDLNGAIPIEPNRASVKQALRKVSEAMKQGDLVVIFPEGSLTYTGNMIRFRFGVEWMAKRDNVPIVPVALKGLWGSIFSRKYRHSKWPMMPRSFRRKVHAKCGVVIPPEKAKINHLQRVMMKLKNSIDD